MQLGNTHQAWGTVQQVMHWFVAAAVVTQLAVGLIFANLPEGDPAAGAYYGVHGTLGLVILTVMAFRFAWRQMHPVPILPETLSPLEKTIARATHWVFYALLMGLPLGGYLMVNARGYKAPFFGFELPAVLDKNEALAGAIFYLHAGGAFLLMALIVLHAAAALRHEFVLRDNTLRRMTPLPLRRAVPRPSPGGKPVERPR